MINLFKRGVRRASLTHLRHLSPVPPESATGLVAQVYEQVEADFGMLAPPVVLHAAAPEVLAAVWSMLRETTVAAGLVGRPAKEAVAAAVSLANSCPYCVDVHGSVLRGLARGPDASAVAAGRLDDVKDPGLRALTQWAGAHGRAGEGPPAPFPAAHGPEIIGVAVTFHYLNRMVNVFLQDSPLPPLTGAARDAVKGAAAWVLGRLARGTPPPGRSTVLLPDAPITPDLAWAAGQAHIAAALARGSAAIDAGGARSLPDGVRQLVTATVRDAAGTVEGDRRWLDRTVADLPADDRPVARLALLMAVASYRVTDDLVEEVRGQGRGDRELVEVAAWASLTAARQFGAVVRRVADGTAGQAG